MIPILYSSDETEFQTNGLGALIDAISCIVSEERNGSYELEMEYPVRGRHYTDISLDRLIYADPSDGSDPQPFSIYKITKPINGIVTVYARHISYRLSFIPVLPFTATGVTEAISGLADNSVRTQEGKFPFELWTDIEDSESVYKQELPQTFRESLGGVEGSILDIFGGEFEWDKFQVKLHSCRGNNNGVRIAYSKNLTDLKQEESNDDSAAAILPYWASQTTSTNGETEVNIVTGSVIAIRGSQAQTYPYDRIAIQDFSRFFSTAPSEEELTTFAAGLMGALDINSNTINLEVSFIALWQTEEYKNIAPLERVHLCDEVTVDFNELGISSTLKVIATEYDVLSERYNKITLGESKSTLISTVASATTTASSIKASVMSSIKTALINQSKKISGNLGGNVVIKYDANGNPTEIFVGDSDNIASMKNCVRINKEGIGFSSKGINGPYGVAITIDGVICADFIQSGKLDASRIDASRLDISGTTVGKDLKEIQKYVQIMPDGIYIGSSDSTTKLIIKNKKISFVESQQQDVDLAYISNSRFYTPAMTIEDNLTIGGYSVSTDAGLAFVWVGKNTEETE